MGRNRFEGTRIRCERHNSFVENREHNRFYHTSSGSYAGSICDSLRFDLVTVDVVERDAALAKARELSIRGKIKLETDYVDEGDWPRVFRVECAVIREIWGDTKLDHDKLLAGLADSFLDRYGLRRAIGELWATRAREYTQADIDKFYAASFGCDSELAAPFRIGDIKWNALTRVVKNAR